METAGDCLNTENDRQMLLTGFFEQRSGRQAGGGPASAEPPVRWRHQGPPGSPQSRLCPQQSLWCSRAWTVRHWSCVYLCTTRWCRSDPIIIQRLSRNQMLVCRTGKNLRGQGTLAQVVTYRPRSPESSFSRWAPRAARMSSWGGRAAGEPPREAVSVPSVRGSADTDQPWWEPEAPRWPDGRPGCSPVTRNGGCGEWILRVCGALPQRDRVQWVPASAR